MPITSFNDLVNTFGAGKSYTAPLFVQQSTTSLTSSRFHHYTYNPTNYGTFSITSGTALQFQNTNKNTAGAMFLTDFSPGTNENIHLAYWCLYANSSALAPSVYYLVDVIGYYPGINLNTTSTQTLTGTVTHRSGVPQRYLAALIATATTGTTGPVITINYTNSAGVANRTSNTTWTLGSVAVGQFITRGLSMVLQSGDDGISSVQSITFSSATTGTASLVLYRILAAIPLMQWNIPTEREYINQIPALPIIHPDSCLQIFMFAGATAGTGPILSGHLQFIWG